jgi:signal transduction histidine kinase
MMNHIKNFFQSSYYKIRIVTTFGLVTICLLLLLARISYLFIKDLYLDQLSERVNTVSRLVASQIDKTYLNILQFGPPTNSTSHYFRTLFERDFTKDNHTQAFVFDKEFKIIIHSDSNYVLGLQESRLLLSKKEILDLKVNQSTSSLPFKGEDDKWYLWGFYRMDNNYWLGFRESASKLEKVDEFTLMFWYIGGAGVIIIFLLSLLIAKSISRPIDKLVDYSSSIGKGNFHTAVPTQMHGEINTLAVAMNRMRENLSEHQKEKEEMLAQIAHEIRNPLGGIELLAGLTKEDLQKQNMSTSYIDRILGEINGLKRLISSYLEFGRPMYPKPEECNLTIILDEVLNNFRKPLNENKISVTNNFHVNKVFFDKEQMKQVITNLISNSIQSMETGGIILVSSSAKKEKWTVSLSDEGKGIPAEHIKNIFEPFFTTKNNGTGLGLAVCRKICIENRSSLTVENNTGKGCTFTISGEYTND